MRHLRPAAAISALVALSLVAAAPGYGVTPAAPVGTTTNVGVPVPAFSWTPVAGAAKYQFQISATSSFSAPLGGTLETRSARLTLEQTIDDCNPCSWHVRAVNSAGTAGPWSATVNWTKSTATPSLQLPANGATVTFPDPVVMRWTPQAGAAKYRVMIDDEPSFAGSTPVDTAGASFAPPAWLTTGEKWWKVAAIDAQDNVSAYSPARHFTWAWPATVSGLTVTDGVADPAREREAWTIFEPRFSWNPLPGAVSYDLEINPDDQWATGSKVCCSSSVIGTSYTPDGLLLDGGYYWRVRAYNATGEAGPWTYAGDTQTSPGTPFQQTYANSSASPSGNRALDPSVPDLHMRDLAGAVGTDLDAGVTGYQTQVPIVDWDAVPGASAYDVAVRPYASGTCGWAGTARWSNRTASTAWTPLANNVSGNVLSGYNVQKDPFSSSLTTGQYCVRVRPVRDTVGGNFVVGDWTYLSPTNSTADWAFDFTGYPDGGACAGCTDGDYVGAADYVAPASGQTLGELPLFTWNPIAGKSGYYVIVSTSPDFSNGIVDYAYTNVPAYAPRVGGTSGPRTYADNTANLYWKVLPTSDAVGMGTAADVAIGAYASFEKQVQPSEILSPADGATIVGQPTFAWRPVDGARKYRVQVSTDGNWGSGTTTVENVTTTATSYTSATKAYREGLMYWRVQAIDFNGVGLSWSAPMQFTQRWPAPQLDDVDNPTAGGMIPVWQWEPVIGATAYEVDVEWDGKEDTFTLESTAFTAIKMTGIGNFKWRVRAVFAGSVDGSNAQPDQNFDRTIAAPDNPVTGGGATSPLLSWDSKAGAEKYRVQIATEASFGSADVKETVTTENSSWAPTLTRTHYLDGGTLYWRVAAIDADANVGQFSAPSSFTLPRRLSITTSGTLRKGVSATLTVGVKTAASPYTPIAGATVRISGAGITARTATTGAKGTVSFAKVKPTKMGTVTVTVTGAGVQPTSKALTVY